MSKIQSFLNGTDVVVQIGDMPVMFCQMINFSDNIQNQMVHGMGDYGPMALEPLLYTGIQGGLRVMRYSDAVLSLANQNKPVGTSNNINQSLKQLSTDGNSLAFTSEFSPAMFLLSATFDIVIYAKTQANTENTKLGNNLAGAEPIYKIKDCMMARFSSGFNVGSLVSEDYQFIGRLLIDLKSEPTKENDNP